MRSEWWIRPVVGANPPLTLQKEDSDMIGKPKRHWFQFHLFTAIVLELVIGLLLYLNMHGEIVKGKSIVYGWPVRGIESMSVSVIGGNLFCHLPQSHILLADLLMCAVIITCIFFLSERLIRRSEKLRQRDGLNS